MRLNVLGPVQLIAAGQPRPVGPPKQRALLALLAMHADRVVPADTLVDRLWAGRPPLSATGGLHVYVSNLRRCLEPDRRPGQDPTVLVSAAEGYGLLTDRLELDVRAFAALTASGTAHVDAGRAHDASRRAMVSGRRLRIVPSLGRGVRSGAQHRLVRHPGAPHCRAQGNIQRRRGAADRAR